jgi:copper(I)-binding protein
MKHLLIAAALAAAAAPLSAFGAGKIEVLQPWSRPAVAGTTGIGYMILSNHGAADALEKVESPLAARVEMHSSTMSGGIMTMQREDRVPVPAGGRTIFGPGAYHLMLIGLTRTLKAGDQAPVTLSFASGEKLKVVFQVTDGTPPAPGPGPRPRPGVKP